MTYEIGRTAEITEVISDERVRQFAELSGDYNPLHLNDSYAEQTEFKGRIAHGMLTAIYVAKALFALNPNGEAGGVHLSQNFKFKAPVYVGDTVTIRVKVKDLKSRAGITVATVATDFFNQDGKLVIKGEAQIIPEPKQAEA